MKAERLMKDEVLREATASDLLIIGRQDCDLVYQSFRSEPYAEILVG
jgi:hypothetical protein